MDGALSSDRHHDGGRRYDNHGYRGGGRGRGRGRHGGRRHHPYRRDDYGGGRHNRRYDDRDGGRRYDGHGGGGYRGGGRGRGRDRQPANRFSTETKSVDPQYAMMKQLTAMVAKMGDLGGAADVADGSGGTAGEVRPVVEAIGRNVQDLVAVLCSPTNAGLFLRFGDGDDENKDETLEDSEGMEDCNPNENPSVKPVNAAAKAGPLATLIHSCATNLPLQTPSYAALTLGVECAAPSSHSGFASRCVELGMRCFGRDLDMLLDCKLVGATDDETEEKEEGERCAAEKTGGYGNGMQIDAYYRAKFMLRYLAHLANIGIVSGKQQQNNNDGNNLSLMGLLQLLVQCACNAASAASSTNGRASLRRASIVLASLVLSTVPYLNSEGFGNSISDLLDELETNVVGQSYSSDYEPGVGWQAILLKGVLDDGDTVSEDDEEEDDDDDDQSPAPSCADTLQDLLRTVRKLVSASPQNQPRFALLGDAPWNTLKTNAASEGMDAKEGVPMAYTGVPLLLDLVGSEEDKRCKCVPYLLEEGYSNDESIDVNIRLLDGILYGRLAIFDAPPDPEDEDDEAGEEAKESDPNLECYVKSYSLTDRFFLSDAIRDVLMCHRPMVSDAGADRSSAKEVAEQIWMISHLFHPAQESEEAMSASSGYDASKGIEYGIVETLLSLIVQSAPRGCDVPASSALNQHLYLARVLLELTKLKPSLVPRAIVLAISGMFEDFIPSLTPVARENLATWLAIHLANTEYQWPKSFWDHWASYVTPGRKRNSRGDFVTVLLHSMAGMTSDGAVAVVKDCLPSGSPLVQSVFLTADEENSPSSSEKDLIDRFWNSSHDPDSIRHFVISDELAQPSDIIEDENEDHSMFHSSVWWRTGITARALLHPITRDKARMARLVESVSREGGDDDAMNGDDHTDEVDPTEDILTDLSDAISRFKPVILAAVARDADAFDSISAGRVDDDELLLAGEVFILKEFEKIIPSWDSVTFHASIECLMKNKIVSALAVATWAIGGESNSSLRDISPQWWKFVSLAVHVVIASVEGSSTDLGGGIGMIMDEEGVDEDANETAVARLEDALKLTAPVIKCVVEKGCQVLASIGGDKKIPLTGADLCEGMKRVYGAILFLFYHHFSSAPPAGMRKLAFASVLKGFAGCDVGWEKVASAFHVSESTEQGKKLLQCLSVSFEHMV